MMERVGELAVESEVARGPASTVYAARRASGGDGERLALKVYERGTRALHPGAGGFEAAIDPGLARFRALEGTGELTRERIHRATDLVRGAPLGLAELGSLRRAVTLWARVARALGKAHARGLAHGHVRPAHAVLLPLDRVLVLDAGVVVTAEGARRDPDAALHLAPEALEDLLAGRDARATPRADVFSLGASLVTALGGASPRADLERLLARRRSCRPPVVTAVTVPVRALDLRALNEALARALDPDPGARFPDATALALALEAAARLEPEDRPANVPTDTRRVPTNTPSDTRRYSSESVLKDEATE